MFEYISGSLAEINPTYAVVEAAGVGYFLNISLQTFTQIEKQQSVKLFTHYIVREDAQILYGFAQKQEREIFRLLIGVSGVGGNTARMVLSTYTCNDVASIIASENAGLLKNVKGLGLKTAQKIIVELKDKISAVGADYELGLSSEAGSATGVDSTVYKESISALTMLGFSKAVAQKAVSTVLKGDPQLSVEDAIRLALKKM